MRFAALETSTDWCSAALYLDGDVVSLEERAGHRHAERLLPMLEALCRRTGTASADLQAVAYGAGPGSFTGLRIACGIAQGIAFARGIPVLGVSTLAALAEESGEQQVLACLDARMHEVYAGALRRAGQAWAEASPARCVPPADVVLPPGDWVGCGSGFEAYPELAARPGLRQVLPGVHPTAQAVARLAAPQFAAGEGTDAALALPTYLRDKVALTRLEREAARSRP